jgi:2-C-methyl-D-erythritol 4-phosphate cytidylyltransferase
MNFAIIAAGGKGKRFQSAQSKQLVPLKNKPLFCWSLKTFQSEKSIDQIVFVYPADEEEQIYRKWLDAERFTKALLVKGGPARYDSVRNGFHAITKANENDVVLIHDAARPLLSSGLMKDVLAAAAEHGAAIPLLAVPETVKEVANEQIIRTLKRDQLFLAQTPQGFRHGILKKAYANAESHGAHWTDEAMLVEAAGHKVSAVAGEKRNLKVTDPDDLRLAEFYLEQGWKE